MEPNAPMGGLDAMEETLRGLKAEGGVRAITLFDGDLAALYATSEKSPEAFWGIFATSPCWSFDREAWHRDLRSRGGITSHECTCGGHHTCDGYLIHDRWILMIMFEAFTSWEAFRHTWFILVTVQRLLPKSGARRRGGTGPLEARVGIPVWWVRAG